MSEFTTQDIHKIIDDAMEKKDRYVTVFISSVGTSVYVHPHNDEKSAWKIVADPTTGKQQYLCGNCNRWTDQGYPHCPWCGEELGLSDEDISKAINDAKKRAVNRRDALNNIRRKKLAEEEKKDD